MELLKEADKVYLDFGADTNIYGVDKQKEIEEKKKQEEELKKSKIYRESKYLM